MNRVRKIKNIIITSFVLFFLTDKSYKLIKGEQIANSAIQSHCDLHTENIVAHRGFSGMYPENSLESIKKALELDCVDMIEIDIRYTKNNKFVLHHDSFINIEDLEIAIEDMELLDLEDEIRVKNYTIYNIENLLYNDSLFLFKRYLSNYNDEETLFKLSTILNNYDFSKPLILDVKTKMVDNKMLFDLNELIKNYKDKIYIQSDYYPFLSKMMELYPDYKYLYIIKYKSSLKYDNDNFCGYTVKYSLLKDIKIKKDKLYLVYTVNSNQKYLNLINNSNYNDDMYIITDMPDYICAISKDKEKRK